MELILGPMLRFVSDTEATIWVETDEPCTVSVLGTSTPTFTVFGHHYALVTLDGLAPGSTIPYTVALDGRQCWPSPSAGLPASVIRTRGHERPIRVAFGSCRAAAPHRAPYTLRPDQDERGRGVDAFRALAASMVSQPPEAWPDLLVLLGDQVYADDLSPATTARVAADRRHRPDRPAGLAADFEEYTWLYHESWTPDLERWAFSVLPSIMIFDDHDMIDDWNISAAWVNDIRTEPWWPDHVIGGLASYWVYQHLGNLSPHRIRREGLLAQLQGVDDGGAVLRDWAVRSEEFTPIPGGYPFSFSRDLGPVHLVMLDCRNGRVLAKGRRAILDDEEWAFVLDECEQHCRHLVLATSLPVFVPGGLHGIQQWNEAVCDGAWGTIAARLGEKLRRALDLEDWPAFDRSYRSLEALLLQRGRDGTSSPPSTITVLSGDIHFSYVAGVVAREGPPLRSHVHQVVSSPIRNVLARRDRRALRFAVTRLGELIGRSLQRSAGRSNSLLAWDLVNEPLFGNSMGLLEFQGDHAQLALLMATGSDDDGNELHTQYETWLTAPAE